MLAYSSIEAAALEELKTHFSAYLSDTRCQIADIDAIVDAIFSEGSKFGCLIDFRSGSDTPRKPYNKDVWAWEIMGLFLIRFSETIEVDLREIVSLLPSTFSNNRRLSGLAANVKVSVIDRPEVADINDVPFYFIPFTIDAIVI